MNMNLLLQAGIVTIRSDQAFRALNCYAFRFYAI